MQKVWRGMNLDNATQYVVMKLGEEMKRLEFFECVIGDRKITEDAYMKVELLRSAYEMFMKKGATLTCQDCGSRHNVELISDMKTCGTLCPSCLKRRTTCRYAA